MYLFELFLIGFCITEGICLSCYLFLYWSSLPELYWSCYCYC